MVFRHKLLLLLFSFFTFHGLIRAHVLTALGLQLSWKHQTNSCVAHDACWSTCKPVT